MAYYIAEPFELQTDGGRRTRVDPAEVAVFSLLVQVRREGGLVAEGIAEATRTAAVQEKRDNLRLARLARDLPREVVGTVVADRG